MSDAGSNKRMKRDAVVSNVDMTLIDKLFYQENSRCDSVYRSLIDLLVRDSAIMHYKVSIGSCDEW